MVNIVIITVGLLLGALMLLRLPLLKSEKAGAHLSHNTRAQ